MRFSVRSRVITTTRLFLLLKYIRQRFKREGGHSRTSLHGRQLYKRRKMFRYYFENHHRLYYMNTNLVPQAVVFFHQTKSIVRICLLERYIITYAVITDLCMRNLLTKRLFSIFITRFFFFFFWSG